MTAAEVFFVCLAAHASYIVCFMVALYVVVEVLS